MLPFFKAQHVLRLHPYSIVYPTIGEVHENLPLHEIQPPSTLALVAGQRT